LGAASGKAEDVLVFVDCPAISTYPTLTHHKRHNNPKKNQGKPSQDTSTGACVRACCIHLGKLGENLKPAEMLCSIVLVKLEAIGGPVEHEWSVCLL